MTLLQPIAQHTAADVTSALRSGTLEMSLGPFSARIKGAEPALLEFLYDVYRDVPVRLQLSDVTDISLNIRPPSLARRYFRRQVIPDPGFQVPAVPLPADMAALAFEMGLNLVVALKCCRLVTFHAGVVANSNGAILISAGSGGGKSTLVSALMQEGYQLFSDEFGLLDMKEAYLSAYPRPVSLKNESIDIVREFTGEEWISSVLSGTPKGQIAYRRPRPDDIEKAEAQAVPKLIVFPKFNVDGEHFARKITSSEAMMRLIPSSTNYHLLGEPAYHALSKMVLGAKSYEIAYGSTEQSIDIMRDLAAGAEL